MPEGQRFPLRIVDGLRLDKPLRDALMPGRIVLVDTVQGSGVSKGQKLIVMEAMKMELILSAPFDGVVETVKVKVGDQVTEGTLLAIIRSGE